MTRKKSKKEGISSIELVQREQAFRLYRKYRDLKKVSEFPGIPEVSILKVWKKEDRWDERIAEIEEKLSIWNELMTKVETDSMLRDDVFHLMLLNKLLETTIRSIVERNLEPTSWKEAIETIKLIFEQKRLLFGRPQSKTEVDLTGMDEKEIREKLKMIYDVLSSSKTLEKELTSQLNKEIPYNNNKTSLDNTSKSNVESISFLDEIEE